MKPSTVVDRWIGEVASAFPWATLSYYACGDGGRLGHWDHTALPFQSRSKGPHSGLTGAKDLDEAYEEHGVKRAWSTPWVAGSMQRWLREFECKILLLPLLRGERCWRCRSRELAVPVTMEWDEREWRSISGMLNQKHGEREAVEMWSITCL